MRDRGKAMQPVSWVARWAVLVESESDNLRKLNTTEVVFGPKRTFVAPWMCCPRLERSGGPRLVPAKCLVQALDRFQSHDVEYM